MSSLIALIPARSGSLRLPHKNIKPLAGHPLIAYTIRAAKESNLFDDVIVSTDSADYAEIAGHYGARTIMRPAEFARDDSPDIEWINHALKLFPGLDYFMILRPTSPFRTSSTVARAWAEYDGTSWMKAVEFVRQHPEKMWIAYKGGFMMPYTLGGRHYLPTQKLAPVYVQNACLEIRPAHNPEPTEYQPFLTEDYEGFDVNTAEDFMLAELLVEKGLAQLPSLGILHENSH